MAGRAAADGNPNLFGGSKLMALRELILSR
jgi:hypothetical protein